MLTFLCLILVKLLEGHMYHYFNMFFNFTYIICIYTQDWAKESTSGGGGGGSPPNDGRSRRVSLLAIQIYT